MGLSPASSGGDSSGGGAAELAYVEATAGVSITATTAAAANTLVSAGAVTFDGATKVCIEFFAPYVDFSASTFLRVMLWDGSTDLGRLGFVQNVDAAFDTPLWGIRYLTPTVGAHTYSIRGYRGGAAGVLVGAGTGGVDTVLPMFVRISG